MKRDRLRRLAHMAVMLLIAAVFLYNFTSHSHGAAAGQHILKEAAIPAVEIAAATNINEDLNFNSNNSVDIASTTNVTGVHNRQPLILEHTATMARSINNSIGGANAPYEISAIALNGGIEQLRKGVAFLLPGLVGDCPTNG